MARFAQIATLACFELEGVDPANKPDLTTITDEAQRQQVLDDLAAKITVKRAARADAEIGIPPSLLEHRDSSALEEGWYLDADENDLRICLTGLDRLIGDVYDIFVLTEDKLDFTN